MRRFWEKVKDTAAFALMFVLGIGIAALYFFTSFIPRKAKEAVQRRNADAETLKAKVAEAHALRAAEAQTQTAAVEKKAEAEKAESPVDFANRFIIDGMKK